MRNALKYHELDNVITLLENALAGDSLQLCGNILPWQLVNDTPVGHKVACRDIMEGEFIIKSGVPIAKASRDISRGEHVHTHNAAELLAGWGDAKHAYNPSQVRELDDKYHLDTFPKLFGYRRSNGRVGFRNHLMVISTVICANKVVENIGLKYPDVIAVSNESGCMILASETERLKTTLLSMARNPNVGAVIFVGLGCEYLEAQMMSELIAPEKPAAYVRIQDMSSSMAATRKAEDLVEEMLALLRQDRRLEVGPEALVLGAKCGCSDWTSGVASNPAIGYASDLIVKAGGTSLLGETQGWFGGEDMLIGRARKQDVADGILKLMREIYTRCLSVGRALGENNPTPGNKAGGITTLVEKALGNVKKSGTAPIEGVLPFGRYPTGAGLYLLDNPGLDPLSVLGETCASANVIVFSTGRGTPTGTPLAPVIKISASPQTCRTFSAHLDVDLSGIINGDLTIEKAGRMVFDQIIMVANGTLTKSEELGHREFAMPLTMGVL